MFAPPDDHLAFYREYDSRFTLPKVKQLVSFVWLSSVWLSFLPNTTASQFLFSAKLPGVNFHADGKEYHLVVVDHSATVAAKVEDLHQWLNQF